MALKGDLASVDLAQVFQMLSLNQKVGILGIDAARASRALHFDTRGVSIFFDEPLMHERVIMQARRRALVDDGALQDARAHSQRTGQTVIETLVAGGYVDDGVLADMMRVELEEDIYDIFFWRQAQFEFYENAQSLPNGPSSVDSRFYFSVDTVIMEAARRIDEWAFIQQRVKHGEDVFRAKHVDPSQLGDVEQHIFGLADGMRNVATLIELTGLPRFQVFKTLAVLHEGGYVELVPDEELWEAARQCVRLDRPQDAIDLYERAITNGADSSGIRAEAAAVYEMVEEYAKAAIHLKRVAEAHVEAGELSEAIGHMQHVVQMLPTDLEAREWLVAMTVGVPDSDRDGFDPSTHGKELVDLYMEIGEIERVRGILEQLLRDSPSDLALKKRLINVHTKAGDTRRVVELYESIADDLVADREPIEAIKYLQKIVMIDRSRRDVSERIRGLYEADERRRSRRRSLVSLGALLMLIAILGGTWYVYERYARDQMEQLAAEVNQMAEAGEFEDAISRLDAFIARYPLTIVSRDVAAEKARVESLRDRHAHKLEMERRREELEREEVRRRYREAWQEYEEHARAERLSKALVAIKLVQSLVEEAGAPQDSDWARRMNVEENRFQLERFISDAARLDREAWEKFEAGDWQQAREIWLKLINEFEISVTANTVRLPVLLRSRPRGAGVFVDGKPLTREGDVTPLVTPTVVMCRPDQVERFELRLSGFATQALEIDSKEVAVAEPTLKVVPKRVFEFDSPVRTPVAVGRGLIGVGLRNGRIAIAVIESGVVHAERQLQGLDEVSGSPTFAVDRCYYATAEGYIASRRNSSGELVWREKMPVDPLHGPVLYNGRLLITDNQGTLRVFDPLTGKNTWSVALGGNAAGAPAFAGGVAYFGLREGRIIGVDLTSRRVVSRSPVFAAGVATELNAYLGGFIFGNDRGQVVGRRTVGGTDAWRVDLDRSLGDGDLVVDGDVVYVRTGSNGVLKLRAADGHELGRIETEHPIVEGPVVIDKRVFVVTRRPQKRARPTDLLQAFSRADLELEWEFEDGGRFVAPPTCDRHSLYLPDSKGNVLRFR